MSVTYKECPKLLSSTVGIIDFLLCLSEIESSQIECTLHQLKRQCSYMYQEMDIAIVYRETPFIIGWFLHIMKNHLNMDDCRWSINILFWNIFISSSFVNDGSFPHFQVSCFFVLQQILCTETEELFSFHVFYWMNKTWKPENEPTANYHCSYHQKEVSAYMIINLCL